MVASARMKFASEARPFGNTGPTCLSLSGHLMDIELDPLAIQGRLVVNIWTLNGY